MFTCLIASLIVGVVVDKIGYKPVAIFGFIATAICIFVLAGGKTYTAALLPCLLLGFGAMALNTAGNTLIPVVLFEGKNPAAASNLGNVFLVSVLGIIVLVPVVLAMLAKYPAAQAGFAIADAFALLKEPAVLVAALALFCYISLEASFCNWLAPYSKEIISKDFPQMDGSVVDATAQQMQPDSNYHSSWRSYHRCCSGRGWADYPGNDKKRGNLEQCPDRLRGTGFCAVFPDDCRGHFCQVQP
jgi:fucose permease